MLTLLLAMACRTNDPVPPVPSTDSPVCGDTRFQWDPDADDARFVAFPDDRYTVDAPDVASGVRVHISDAGWLTQLSVLAQSMLVQADEAPGFARIGQVVMAFDGDLGDVPSLEALHWIDLDSGADHPYAARLASDSVLVLEPLRPLAPAHRYAVVLDASHLAADGDCITPSSALRDAVMGKRQDRLGDRLAEVPDAIGIPSSQISAAVVFTSADGGAPMAAAADDVHAQVWSWAQPLTCDAVGDTLRCEGMLAGADYRALRPGASPGAVAPHRAAEWSLPVSLRAPIGPEEVPLILYGHGMNGSRREIDFLWQYVEDLDVAVVAMDAMYHGDHPTSGDQLPVLPFLGIDLLALSLDTAQTRGSFDQTALERLQLLEALGSNPQIPGGPSIDLTRVGYHGSSLGGLLGPSVVAHSDVDAGFFTVAGGNLIRLATSMDIGEGTTMGDLLAFIVGGDEQTWEVFLSVAQVALDAADPAVHAAHPRVGEAHVFLPVAQHDETVAKAAGQALARSLALPQVEPVQEPVPTLTTAIPPLSGNEGGLTRGYFQYAEVTSGGALVPATHNTTLNAPEVAVQVRAWWEGWANTGVPVIIAP